jgi:hypothetical protein
MTTRELDAESLRHDEDWEGHCAAVTCPSCGKVYIVTSAHLDLGPRECPNCGRSAAQCYGTRLGGGSASVMWRKPGEIEPSGFRRILGMLCLIVGGLGLAMGMTFSVVFLVAQFIESGFRALSVAVAMLILAGCLIAVGIKLQR